LCEIIRDIIPNKVARGLWTNTLNGHGKIIREVFGTFNLNCHGKQSDVDEMRHELPGVAIFGAPDPNNPDPEKALGHSRHSSMLRAIQDRLGTPDVPDEKAMWALIEKCDVNLYWSGTIYPFDNEDGTQDILAYFCEMAGTLERIYGRKHGIPVTNGWWRNGMDNEGFTAQHKEWCPKCGFALKDAGHIDMDKTDDLSPTHAALVPIAIKRKQKFVMHDKDSPVNKVAEGTDYTRMRT
jgi:hypothetical protein